MVSLLPLFLLFIWTERTKASEPPDLPFVEYLDQNRLVRLSWGFDNHQGNITFELMVNTTGWVGFGFSPNGEMKGSDIVIGGIRPAGSYFAVRNIIKTACIICCDAAGFEIVCCHPLGLSRHWKLRACGGRAAELHAPVFERV